MLLPVSRLPRRHRNGPVLRAVPHQRLRAKLDTSIRLRNKHYKRARAPDERLHASVDLSSVKFFEVYVKRDGFQVKPGAAINVEFQRLAKFKGWGPLKFLARWRLLLAELVHLLHSTFTVSITVTSTLDTPAPSEMFGVRLPLTRSDCNTEYSEYNLAPSVSLRTFQALWMVASLLIRPNPRARRRTSFGEPRMAVSQF
jgi:hypothetical protein